MDRDQIFEKIRAVGRAALTLDIENSHSGNISIRCADKHGNNLLCITATGSQKGELTKSKICFPALDRINHGHFKASSETDIHTLILRIPGLNATMHGHTKMATVVTLDDAPMPKKNPRAPMIPLDPLGVRYLGHVPVDWFSVASGSKEMAETVAERLKEHPVSMVQAHGAFAGGTTLEQAFFHLCLTEHAGEVIHFLEILGANLELLHKNAAEISPWLKANLPDYSVEGGTVVDFGDEPETVTMFYQLGFRIFESRYSPFHTGSMSTRCSNTMLYAPKASMPHDLPGPLLEIPLSSGDAAGDMDLSLHRMIYKTTPLKSIIHCYVSEAQAISLYAMEKSDSDVHRIIPIDAEGGFLYPSVPVLPPHPDPDTLAKALLDYRVVIVKYGGVWAAGEQSAGEAVRHISSVKDICFYRIMGKMKGLNLAAMEADRAKNW